MPSSALSIAGVKGDLSAGRSCLQAILWHSQAAGHPHSAWVPCVQTNIAAIGQRQMKMNVWEYQF